MSRYQRNLNIPTTLPFDRLRDRLPFGGERTNVPSPNPQSPTDFTYTGQRDLASGMGGLMDYKARFYSPMLGRFLQPDSLIPDQTNPQAWNRYSYVGNRPINLNDPTGHFACPKNGYFPGCSDPAPDDDGGDDGDGDGDNDPSHLALEELGGVPATQPYGSNETYGSVAEEGWCENVSTCPGDQLPQNSLSTTGPQAFGVANDWLIGGLAGSYDYDPDVIHAKLVFQQFSSGGVGLQSITIINESHMVVDLRYVMLTPKINNASNLPGNGNAYIVSPPRIMPAGDNSLSGPIQPGTSGFISLRPSGNSNNPNNEFSSNQSVTIKYIIGIYGGNAWPPVTYHFNGP